MVTLFAERMMGGKRRIANADFFENYRTDNFDIARGIVFSARRPLVGYQPVHRFPADSGLGDDTAGGYNPASPAEPPLAARAVERMASPAGKNASPPLVRAGGAGIRADFLAFAHSSSAMGRCANSGDWAVAKRCARAVQLAGAVYRFSASAIVPPNTISRLTPMLSFPVIRSPIFSSPLAYLP